MNPHLLVKRLLWGAFVTSIFLFLLMIRLTPPQAVDRADAEFLPQVLTVVALTDLVLSFIVPRFMKGTGPERDRAALLISLALCESVALFGFVLHYATGWPHYWVLFLLALLGMLFHFPRSAGSTA